MAQKIFVAISRNLFRITLTRLPGFDLIIFNHSFERSPQQLKELEREKRYSIQMEKSLFVFQYQLRTRPILMARTGFNLMRTPYVFVQ